MNQLTVLPQAHVPAFSMSDVARIAEAIARGGLFGSKDPNQVLTLCLLAQAEGQHPAVVFRDYHIINGKPAKKAEAMLRDFISSGGRVEWHALTDEIADATFSHQAGGTIRIDWTLKRAQQAGISTPMWKKYPRQMLRSRVISEGVRSVCPSATSGLYEENEVRDIVAQDTRNPAMEAQDGGLLTGHSQEETRRVEPEQSATDTLRDQLEQSVEQGKAAKGWREPGSIYSTPTKLHQALITHQEELRRLGIEGTFDDLDGYVSAPEYHEFIRVADLHARHYLDGDLPEGVPPEFIQTFALEQKTRDLIALRGNVAGETEPA